METNNPNLADLIARTLRRVTGFDDPEFQEDMDEHGVIYMIEAFNNGVPCYLRVPPEQMTATFRADDSLDKFRVHLGGRLDQYVELEPWEVFERHRPIAKCDAPET